MFNKTSENAIVFEINKLPNQHIKKTAKGWYKVTNTPFDQAATGISEKLYSSYADVVECLGEYSDYV